MFRSLYEGFQEEEASGPRDQLAAYFLQSGPYTIPTTDAGLAAVRAPGMAQKLEQATSMAALGQIGEQIVKGIANRFQPSQVPPEIATAQKQCLAATIDSAAGLGDNGSKYRCGWLYEKGPGGVPKISKGWLGSADGPLRIFPEEPKGQWFWDLELAKQQILTDTCAAATQCEHLGSSAFAGKCGFCKTTGRSVPIDSSGQPLYNNALATQCAPSQIIKSVDQCPKPKPAPVIPLPPGAVASRTYKVCDPLPGDRLRQDCLLQQVRAAGCSDEGSLATALATNTNPNDYAAELRKSNAFRVYQERSPIKFNDALLKDGKGTIAAALDTFRGLHSQAAAATGDTLVAAAKDICMARGTLDKFDFCSELSDATPPPFSLDCLQKEFKRAGGQPVGAKYPRAAAAEYQALPNWGTYKSYLRTLAAQIKSDDVAVQTAALRDFLGIERETLDTPKLPKLDSYEAFYFNDNGSQFVGRRIRDAEGGMPIVQPTKASCVVIADLRPKAADKIRFAAGKAMIAFNDYLKEGHDPGCVSLKAGGGNVTTISWYNSGAATAEFSASYGPCSSAAQKPIPKDWISMTQEYKAPVLSFEVGPKGFMERRLPDVFPLKVVNIYTEARGSNTLKAPANRGYITFTSPASSVLEIIPVAAAAFNTLTLCFRINRPVIGKERFFTVGTASGAIEFTLTTGGGSGTLMNITLTTDGAPTTQQLPITMGDWLLLTVAQTSQLAGIRNAIKVAVQPVRDIISGTAYEKPTNTTTLISAAGRQPFHASRNWFGFGKLQVGDTATPSAGMDISHFRLYDYDLSSEELKRDVADGWTMTWF